ncbi:helix-turn-helix domain-containing protein [Clostridium tyrobutyricum]|jgi:transcriptional regulator with XRE-family HTH domain|uniref:helix-turn-helix domain-containing protein n=1 Tax=Clostridium tyrobutyricum TaxID=1519 RepID=UPI00242D591D|nr:helix-turn-helix transcriptional regulator [Clostridium tyrobutyricum]
MLFGDFIKMKREYFGISLKEAAEYIDVSPSYLCDIEKNRKYAPLNKLKIIMNLYEINNAEEIHLFYDMAGESRKEVAPDIANVLMRSKSMRNKVRNLIYKTERA